MIVVTGAAGFIGSNILARLEAATGPVVVACDRLGSDERWRNIAKRRLYDIVTPEQLPGFLDRVASRVEAILHMGAISATTVTDGDAVLKENVRTTLDLLDWCTRHHVRFIYASSAATYGDGAGGFDDDESPEALARLLPLNLYGWSKLAVDRAIAERSRAGDHLPPQCAGLRFFNVYGPNEYHKADMMSLAAKLHPQILETGRARLFKSHRPDFDHGGQSRDFIHVDDCVDVVLWLLETPGASGLFNVGTGRARSFRDLALACFAAAGRTAEIDYIDMPEAIRGQYQYWTEAPMAKLRAAGYEGQFTPLEEGVRRYWQDYLLTGDRYR